MGQTTETTTTFTKNGDVPPVAPVVPAPPLPPAPPVAPLPPVPPLPPVAPPTDSTAAPATSSPPRFRLHRSRTDRMLGGVCGGLAESLGADPALVRLGLVALTVLGAGSGVVLYVAAWLVAPEADAE